MNAPAECRVVVAGAGAAGVLAAVAAARDGADVLLVEPALRPGGAGRSQFHRHLCGLYANGGDAPGPLLNPGLVEEVVDRLRARGARGPQRMGRTWVWPLRDGDLEAVLDDLLRASPAVVRLFGAHVDGFSCDPSSGGLRFDLRRGGAPATVLARAAVDATGQAGLAALAGWEREETPAGERQLAGYTMLLDGVDMHDTLQALRVPLALRRACDRGELQEEARHTVFIPCGESTALLRLNVPADTPPPRAERAARDALDLLRRSGPAFARATIAHMSGVEPRDRGRIAGRYRLTAEDVLAARAFPDAAARGAWPMERWLPDRGSTYDYGPDEAAYDLPLRCMLSPASDRVLFAGRSLSCDPMAFGSLRVMGTCMATGAAAGREAARRSA